jgi:3-hydroxy-9,10-secoandrosta-1,3,5(10)-triene-9,17-dione monooxygenase
VFVPEPRTAPADWTHGGTMAPGAALHGPLYCAASSSAAKRGTRLQRYYRDVAMYQGHISAQPLTTAAELARVHFALPDTLF